MSGQAASGGGSISAAIGPIRVLVVDDHNLMRQGLKSILETLCKFLVVGEAGDGQAAIDAVQQCSPNVILMDVNMPGMNGIEATRRITQIFPHVRVVGLSMLQSKEIREAMLQAGAAGYLTKSAEAKEVCATVRAVFAAA